MDQILRTSQPNATDLRVNSLIADNSLKFVAPASAKTRTGVGSVTNDDAIGRISASSVVLASSSLAEITLTCNKITADSIVLANAYTNSLSAGEHIRIARKDPENGRLVFMFRNVSSSNGYTLTLYVDYIVINPTA